MVKLSRKRKKATSQHWKRAFFHRVILSRVPAAERRAGRRRRQHVAGLFLSLPSHVPVQNQSFEPVYWPNGSSKQMTYRLPSSGLGRRCACFDWRRVLCIYTHHWMQICLRWERANVWRTSSSARRPVCTCTGEPARLAVDMLYPICQRAAACRTTWWWETAITSLSLKAAERRYSVSNTGPWPTPYHNQFTERWANDGTATHSSTRKNLHNPAWAENHPVGFLASLPCNTVPALAETQPERITHKEGCFE